MLANYALLVAAAIFLTIEYIFTKIYQKNTGDTIRTSFVFNAIGGLICAITFWISNNFRIEITPFSVLVASLLTIAVTAYSVLGFVIMAHGKLAYYTLFAMTGGMVVPYVYGVLFLNETLSVQRIIALILILVSVVISNYEHDEGNNRKVFSLCLLVFLLNGSSNILSKVHQVGCFRMGGTTYANVPSSAFGILTGGIQCLLCIAILLVLWFYGKDRQRDEIKKGFKLKNVLMIVLGATFGGISYKFQLDGATNLPATVMYPFVTGETIVFTGLCGTIIFKEKMTKKLLICIILCVIGTCLFI